jgi:hypothetical protein
VLLKFYTCTLTTTVPDAVAPDAPGYVAGLPGAAAVAAVNA